MSRLDWWSDSIMICKLPPPETQLMIGTTENSSYKLESAISTCTLTMAPIPLTRLFGISLGSQRTLSRGRERGLLYIVKLA
jgi:hypothetical protein